MVKGPASGAYLNWGVCAARGSASGLEVDGGEDGVADHGVYLMVNLRPLFSVHERLMEL